MPDKKQAENSINHVLYHRCALVRLELCVNDGEIRNPPAEDDRKRLGAVNSTGARDTAARLSEDNAGTLDRKKILHKRARMDRET